MLLMIFPTFSSGEPLQFSGKPRNSADINVIGLKEQDFLGGVAKKSMNPYPQRPSIEQARSLSPQAQEFVNDPNKLWCTCQQTHNNRFMIACDTCSEWFHGSCVDIKPKKGKEIEDNGLEWNCPKCPKFSEGVAIKSMKPNPKLQKRK